MGWKHRFCIWIVAALPAFAAFAAVSALAADAPPRLPVFDAILAEFVEQNKVYDASLSVVHQGRLVHDSSAGRARPYEQYLISSLSKAVTAACIATLVQDRRLTLETRLADVLDGFWREHGRPGDARIPAVTVRQILTHRSGFEANNSLDPTMKAMRNVLKSKAAKDVTLVDLMKDAFKVPLRRDSGLRYEYSNVDYMALSLIVEVVSGRGYEDYCRQAVLVPQGIGKVGLHPIWGLRYGSGGWAMTPAEYLAFLKFFEAGPDRPLKEEMRRFLLEAPDSEISDKGKSRYTLGLIVQKFDDGTESWSHSGGMTWREGKDRAGVDMNWASRTWAERFRGGQSYALFFDGEPTSQVFAAFRSKIVAAIRATKQWPAEDGFVALGLK